MRQQPNLVFIMPDQLRADFLSSYGAAFVATPHIDSLADQGVRYPRAYSPSPLCGPARALLLTGRNAIANGVLNNEVFLRPDLGESGIHTWSELLVRAGYATAAIGKMHFYPWDLALGFQHRVICEDKRWLQIEDDYDHHLRQHGYHKMHGNEHEDYLENRGAFVHQVPLEHSWDRFVGDEACRYIRDHQSDAPFAMMVGFPGPHCPYDPSAEYLDTIDEEAVPEAIPDAGLTPQLRQNSIATNKGDWNGVDYTEFTLGHKRKIRAHYAALVKQIDDEVGAILQTLRASGRWDDTVVIFCSDHGDHLGDHDLIGKGDFYEASIKVPLLVRLPWAQGSVTCPQLTSIGAITPSLLALAGCQVPAYMDAQPLPELGFATPPAQPPRSTLPQERIFGFLSGGCMNFDGTWKLVRYAGGAQLLFNLAEDPGEQINRLADPACAGVARRLDAELTEELLRSVGAANSEKLVAHAQLYDNPDFGRPGWQRRYPQTFAPDA